jgi:hypothetical protein
MLGARSPDISKLIGSAALGHALGCTKTPLKFSLLVLSLFNNLAVGFFVYFYAYYESI